VSQTAPHQALYRRWRAQTFGQMVGQEAVVETLRNAVRMGRVAHAILFVGPRGTGKTSLARILAKALNCTDLRDGDPCDVCPSCVAIREGRAMDLVEIDAASNRGIDAIRELRERINYAPADLRRKIYILDEAHQITKDAWNALLKSLEEPPEFVVFMFASTHPEDFPPAILSRLQRFDVRRLTTNEIEGKLRRILEAEGREADKAAMHLIARLAAGGMRDAESMLDQLLASSGDRLDEDRVRDLLGLADADTVDAFVGALATGDVVAGVRILDALEDRGRDLRAFLDQVIEVIRGAIVGAAEAGAAGLRHGVVELVPVARRLAGIDPNRAGVGGLRLQLELVLFPVADGVVHVAPRSPAAVSFPPATEPMVTAARASSGSAAVGPAKSAPGSPASGGPPTLGSGAQPRARDHVRPPDPDPVVSQPLPAEPPADPAAPALDPAPSVDLAVHVGGDLAVLRDRWPEIVTRISKHPPTKPLISVCRPIAIEDGSVTLGFPEDQGFLRDVAERRRSVLEEGIGAVLGRPVSVRCVATNLDLVASLPADAEAAFVLAEARRIFGGDGPLADPVD
jgi:DNA polymerase-3 subunit gamma/tau